MSTLAAWWRKACQPEASTPAPLAARAKASAPLPRGQQRPSWWNTRSPSPGPNRSSRDGRNGRPQSRNANAVTCGPMTPQERTLLEGLMHGLDVPRSRARRPAWMEDGACLEHPEVQFIPLNKRTEENADEARAICSGCLCRDECLAYALSDTSLVGIWAGTTTAERRKMRRQRAA